MSSYFTSTTSSTYSSSSDDQVSVNFDLAEGDTQLVEIPEESTFFKTNVDSGTISTYFFRIRPSLSNTIYENNSVSASLVQNEYQLIGCI